VSNFASLHKITPDIKTQPRPKNNPYSRNIHILLNDMVSKWLVFFANKLHLMKVHLSTSTNIMSHDRTYENQSASGLAQIKSFDLLGRGLLTLGGLK
jgi:hypothetical protein